MRTDVIIMVLIYEVLVVIGIGVLLIIRDRKKNTGDSFAVAGRSMGFGLLVPTMTLTALGNPHIVGLFEMSYGMGAVALWFAFANTVHFVILCLCTGPWLRKMKVATVGEALDNLYGKKVGLGISCAMSGQQPNDPLTTIDWNSARTPDPPDQQSEQYGKHKKITCREQNMPIIRR